MYRNSFLLGFSNWRCVACPVLCLSYMLHVARSVSRWLVLRSGECDVGIVHYPQLPIVVLNWYSCARGLFATALRCRVIRDLSRGNSLDVMVHSRKRGQTELRDTPLQNVCHPGLRAAVEVIVHTLSHCPFPVSRCFFNSVQ